MVDLPFTKAVCKALSVVQMQSFSTIYENVWIINEKRVQLLCVIICSVKLVAYTVVLNKVKAKGEKNRNERCNF